MNTMTVSERFCGDFMLLLKYNKAHLYFVAQTGILNSFPELIVTFFVSVKTAIIIAKLFFSLPLLEERFTICICNTYGKIYCKWEYVGAISKYQEVNVV